MCYITLGENYIFHTFGKSIKRKYWVRKKVRIEWALKGGYGSAQPPASFISLLLASDVPGGVGP